MKRRLGCLSRSGLIAAAASLAVILVLLLVSGGRLLSPGALSAQGGGEVLGGVRSHAETGGRCSACHAAFWGDETMSGLCLACHAEIGFQLQDPESLHGALQGRAEHFRCQDCHTEHGGEAGPLTAVDPETFPHQSTGYALDGHRLHPDSRSFACTDCHSPGPGTSARLHLGRFDPAICAACHRDMDADYMEAHLASFGSGCLACHDGVDSYGRGFDHDQTAFALTGKHEVPGCAACHGGARSIAELEATPQDCYACHQEDDAHQGQFGADCSGCHTPEGWEQVTFDHNLATFPLTGRHQEVDCGECHADGIYRGTPQECVACHQEDDAHDGQLGVDCAGCHTLEGWEGATFDHNLAAFPLTGRHQEVGCGGCHVDGIYQGTPQECVACHQEVDAHDGDLGPDCARCHTPEGWEGVAFDHSLAAFPLTGRHLEVECGKCHTDNIYRGTPQECATCHQADDTHQGQLGTDCAGCHTPEGWEQVTFDHNLAAFPLTGRHQEVECRRCHTDDIYRGTPQECVTCHREDDTHQGQLGTDCAGCHTAEGWEQVTFEHNLAAFPLTGRHQEVECRECHADGVYRGTPQECVSCHKADDAHEGRFGPGCAQCHTPEGWEQVTFDHTLAAFPLTGRHQEVECRECHADGIYRGTSQGCVACHQADDAHEGQFGPGCAQCHTAEGWEQVTFDHNRTAFVLQGAHTRVPCLECHTNGVFRGTPSGCAACHDDPSYHAGLFGAACTDCHTADGWTPANYGRPHTFPLGHGEDGPSPCRTCHPDRLANYTCYGCHEHEPAGIEEEHREEGIVDLQDCAGCHPTGQEEGESGDD